MTIGARHYRRALLVLLGAAAALRLGWALWKMHQGLNVAVTAEAFDEARHVASGQGLAGAYGDDLPTAHLLPIPPLIAGGVYALLGTATPAAELVLCAYATALAVGRILLFERCFARLDVAPGARLGAVAALALASPYLSHEAITFRTWEGGLAGMVEGAFLLLLLRALGSSRPTSMAWLWPPSTAALLFFINPPLGLAAVACLLVAVWPRRHALPVGRMVLIGTTVLALLVGPWAWRNEQVLGHPVLLRSNAGLELALAMHPGARAGDPRAIFGRRLDILHPRHSRRAYALMRAMGGEVEYSAALGRATQRWMTAHPGEVAALMVRHLVEQLFPPAWVMDTETGAGRAIAKSAIAWIVAALGLAGSAWALARHRRDWLYPALLIAVPLVLMTPFEPYHRYIFLLFSPLAFAGADGVEQLWRRVSRRPAPAAPGTPVAGSRDAP